VLVQQDELAYTSVAGTASLAALFEPQAKKDGGLWCISIAPYSGCRNTAYLFTSS